MGARVCCGTPQEGSEIVPGSPADACRSLSCFGCSWISCSWTQHRRRTDPESSLNQPQADPESATKSALKSTTASTTTPTPNFDPQSTRHRPQHQLISNPKFPNRPRFGPKPAQQRPPSVTGRHGRRAEGTRSPRHAANSRQAQACPDALRERTPLALSSRCSWISGSWAPNRTQIDTKSTPS